MKTIIVTGSSSGFGLLTVQLLAERGYTVYATMRNIRTKNAAAAQTLRNWALVNDADVRIVELDVTNDQSVNRAVQRIIDDCGHIDVLINNAGVMMWGLSETLSTKQLEEIFQLNVFGADRMNKAVLPHMHLENHGLIIQLSSGLSRLHLPCLGAFSATKAAIDVLSETLHYELSKTEIDCVIIQPGVYPSTDLFDKLIPPDTPLTSATYGVFGSKIEQCINRLFMHNPEARDPGEVAGLIAEIISTPRDQRRLWSSVGIRLGEVYVDAINENTYQYSQRMQNLLGISSSLNKYRRS